MVLNALLKDIRACRLCEEHLPHGPKPVLIARKTTKILIVGQAPGRRVHASGIPFDDPSGDRLRLWMGIDRKIFYNHPAISIIPMGFCYPGTGKSGDFPPRKECAETWRSKLMAQMPDIYMILAIGQYAHAWHLAERKHRTLTETVWHWRDYAPEVFPLPHPSPRNNRWFKRNPWFDKEIVPAMREHVQKLL